MEMETKLLLLRDKLWKTVLYMSGLGLSMWARRDRAWAMCGEEERAQKERIFARSGGDWREGVLRMAAWICLSSSMDRMVSNL